MDQVRNILVNSSLNSTLQRARLLSIYFTAGYPNAADTSQILLSLQEGGVDIVEIGFPFSDPIADGPVIQKSSQRAIQNGITLKKIFSQLEQVKDEVRIPVILMGYLNPVLRFGMEQFCTKCNQTGVSGVIIPDLPISEFMTDHFEIFKQNNLSAIFLVTPTTSEERVRLIDSISSSFIYAVSDSAITGVKKDLTEHQLQYLKRLSEMNLKHPVLTGFGISNAAAFQSVCKFVSGGIIGSAFIRELSNGTDIRNSIANFLTQFKANDHKIN